MNNGVFTFKVPGEPKPWTVWARRGPPPPSFLAMQAWQEQIQVAVLNGLGVRRQQSWPLFTGLVEVEMSFFRELPATAPKRPRYLDAWVNKHIKDRPDLGNYVKAAEDALQGLLFGNDSCIVSSISKKWYAPRYAEAFTEITVREIGG